VSIDHRRRALQASVEGPGDHFIVQIICEVSCASEDSGLARPKFIQIVLSFDSLDSPFDLQQ